jgi:FixJ family two-component response regulator
MQFLIIDDDPEYRRVLRYHLEVEWPDALVEDYQPSSAGQLPDGFPLKDVDFILLGHPAGQEEGLHWLRMLNARTDCPPVMLFAEDGDELLAVDALKGGALDYFPKSRLTHHRLIGSIRAAMAPRDRSPATGDYWGVAGELGSLTKHRFVSQLHSGDLSSVYLAEEEGSREQRAFKVLKDVPDAGGGRLFDRFLQEFEVIAGVDHPNVVRIFDLGVADDHAYIAMEYLSAGTLAERLVGPMEPEEALEYLKQVGRALAAIHKAGILHRDLKPANIMLRADGSLALIDFGLAKQMRLEAAITGTGQIFGTPYYMSPEQGHAEPVDERSDLYSLGCIFHEMLTGRRPFAAATPMAVIYKHAHAPRPELDEPLAELQPALDRMLAVRPDDRFQSARELLKWLETHRSEVAAS